MSLRVDQDHARFKHIIRGRIRQNLRRYISKGELLGKQGKDVVSIPIPQIDIPRFRFADKQGGGVGQGDGQPGDAIGDPGDGSQSGQAGSGEGEHVLEVDVSLEELAQIHGIGPKIAESVGRFFASPDQRATLHKLLELGVRAVEQAAEVVEGPLSGASFCVTGTLSEPREAVHALIRAAGGVIHDRVAKGTTYLVAGAKVGETKLAAAETAEAAADHMDGAQHDLREQARHEHRDGERDRHGEPCGREGLVQLTAHQQRGDAHAHRAKRLVADVHQLTCFQRPAVSRVDHDQALDVAGVGERGQQVALRRPLTDQP